jgi:hypothetical protein
VDHFLASRGFRESAGAARLADASPPAGGASTPQSSVHPAETPVDFVCEEDVRQAAKHGKKITIGERTIVTPAARDLGEQHRIFVQGSWPR